MKVLFKMRLLEMMCLSKHFISKESYTLKSSLLILGFAIFTGPFYAQNFIDISEDLDIAYGLSVGTYGGGASFYDINNDGWDDITLGLEGLSPIILLNEEGNLVEQDWGIPAQVDAKIVLWFDLENDGDSDLFITNRHGGNKLYLNDGNYNFTDISIESNISQNELETTYGAGFADMNNDRLLDLYVCNYNWDEDEEFIENSFYINNGDGTFTDATEEYGFGGGLAQSFQPAWVDYNRDGLVDLYVINDRVNFPNKLYVNHGDGMFVENAYDAGLAVTFDCMSNSWGDIDNDGDLDLYLSNSAAGNQLLQNTDGFFFDITEENGMEVNDNSWNANWFDFDNDGWLDLHVSTALWNPSLYNPNAAFRNIGNGSFESADSLFPNNTHMQYTSAIGDYNNDGYSDMLGLNAFTEETNVWLNPGGERHHIKITLEGVLSNRGGIGSWIDVHANGMSQTRYTACGEDYMSQDSQHITFGIGDASIVDSVVVSWPSGWTDKFYDLAVDQNLNIKEGDSFQVEIVSGSFCEGMTHSIVAPGGYESYQWNSGDSLNVLSPSVEGEYYVVVENDFGLFTTSNSIYYQSLENPDIVPNVTDVSCYGDLNGSINLEFISDSPHWLTVWDEINNTNLVANDLSAGIYHYTSYDLNGCFTEGEVEVFQPDSLYISGTINNPSCPEICDGYLEIEFIGGTGPYDFIDISENLCAGEYEVLVSDQLGCSASSSFEIIDPEPLTVDVITTPIDEEQQGSALAVVEGGSPPYNFYWNGTEGTEFIDELELSSYELTISDSNGCEINASFDIVLNTNEHFLENFQISPNPTSDFIAINGPKLDQIDWIRIYSVEGKLMMNFKPNQNSIDLSELPPSVYILTIKNQNKLYNFRVLKK